MTFVTCFCEKADVAGFSRFSDAVLAFGYAEEGMICLNWGLNLCLLIKYHWLVKEKLMSTAANQERIEARLQALGLTLPEAVNGPPGVKLPFSFVRVRGNLAYISGHGPQNPDGSIAEPFGKVGAEISVEQGYYAARLTALSMLGNLKREVGDLERVVWLKVLGMVNAAPDFTQHPAVINGFSDLILELYGPERGAHARSAVGMAGLPFGMPVEVEALVELT